MGSKRTILSDSQFVEEFKAANADASAMAAKFGLAEASIKQRASKLRALGVVLPYATRTKAEINVDELNKLLGLKPAELKARQDDQAKRREAIAKGKRPAKKATKKAAPKPATS